MKTSNRLTPTQILRKENDSLKKELAIEFERATHYRDEWQKVNQQNIQMKKQLLQVMWSSLSMNKICLN